MNPSEYYLCDDCHKSVVFEFHVNPDLWEKVTEAKDREPGNPYDGGEGYLCLSCFTMRAASKGITSFQVSDVVLVEED